MEKVTRRGTAVPPGRAAWDDELRVPTPFQRLRSLFEKAIPRGALILSSLTFVNFGLGLLETKVLAHVYGAGPETDAFFAAFALPQLVLDTLVVGGLISSFVPIYVGLKDEDQKLADEFGRAIFTLALLVIGVLVAVMIVFAPECISITAAGFKGAQRDLAINLFRLLAATQILMAAIWVLGEVLIAKKRWLSYAIAPLTYSTGIIAGALLLGGDGQLGIYGAAVGAFAGALGYALIRLAGAIRNGFVPLPRLSLRTRGLRQYMVLMLPKMASQPVENTLITFYFTAVASPMAAGAIANLYFARKFQTAPELVIGGQFAIAAFPGLSAAADEGDRRSFRRIFGSNLASIAVLSTLAAVGLLAFGWLGVRILLAGGAYTAQDVATATLLVGVFAVSIPLESMVELVARAIYATKNTGWPMVAAWAGFITLVATAQLLVPLAGLVALPAAYALGMAVRLSILAVALAPRMDAIGRPAREWAPPPRLDRAHQAGTVGWGENRRGRARNQPSAARLALGIVGIVFLMGAGLLAAGQALKGAGFGFQPETTPWTRVRPSAIAEATASATPSPTAQGTVPPVVGPTPTPTPPGQFAMDLYEAGDFVGEFRNTWCVPAAMQTMMNIMDQGADATEATQEKLFNLGNSIATSKQGTPEPISWAQGLQQLGYGKYAVGVQNSREAAVKQVVRQIRLTNRPAGLVVWYGWHSWVVSGFVASADPANTNDFVVRALYIEDVWYNRKSTLWNKDRDGYSRPPDTEVDAGLLYQDFKAWDQAVNYPEYQKRFVVIVPVK